MVHYTTPCVRAPAHGPARLVRATRISCVGRCDAQAGRWLWSSIASVCATLRQYSGLDREDMLNTRSIWRPHPSGLRVSKHATETHATYGLCSPYATNLVHSPASWFVEHGESNVRRKKIREVSELGAVEKCLQFILFFRGVYSSYMSSNGYLTGQTHTAHVTWAARMGRVLTRPCSHNGRCTPSS